MMEQKKDSTKHKWKDRLLSSSFPLEFDVAKKFAACGFVIDADYSYARSDQGIEKDFSVDLLERHIFQLTCLMKSKHTYLFYPNANIEHRTRPGCSYPKLTRQSFSRNLPRQ